MRIRLLDPPARVLSILSVVSCALAGILFWLMAWNTAWADSPPMVEAPGSLSVPRYTLDVALDSSAHRISGTLKIELAGDDPRAGKGLVFHLPPNRFLQADDRGRRRSTDSLPFATNFRENHGFDPLWPDGFSSGHIEIHEILDGSGRPRNFTLQDNLQWPDGYSVREGLLKVDPQSDTDPPPGSSPGKAGKRGRSLSIRFSTWLPHRYWEGWSDKGILAELWHPVLAELRDGEWVADPYVPRAGRYRVRMGVDKPGRLFLGRGWEAGVSAGDSISTGDLGDPMRSLPLVFLDDMPSDALHDYELSIRSYFTPGHEHGGNWALKVTAGFLEFVREKYRLPPPDTRITLIEVPLPPGDIRTVGSLVLIPEEYFNNPPMLDRVFLAQLTRALGQVWFGEAVWSHRDRQSWLHLGLSGYLSLDFFHSLYGWSAGIHNVVDWLQPKYREHFFEAPVREMMRRDKDAPLMLSLSTHEEEQSALLAAHNKAPLVMRSLFHVVGREAFSRGLNALYFRHRYREVTESVFIGELEALSGQDLSTFVEDWFLGMPRIDFSVEDWGEEQTPAGYKVKVRVARSGATLLPVEVRIRSKGGYEETVRWEGTAREAELDFLLPDPAAEIAIDPDEYWLELDRKNNHSNLLYRLRPIFDWSKQRELLVALRFTGGGNNIDGNYGGLGVNLRFNENNALTMIPIYGQRTKYTNYQVLWEWRQFLLPALKLRLELTKLGGTTLQGIGLDASLVDNQRFFLEPGLEIRKETVLETGYIDEGTTVYQPSGKANNIRYLLKTGKKQGLYYGNRLELEVVDGRPSYGGRFDFSTALATFNQRISLGNDHHVDWLTIRGGSEGDIPLQMRHALGGPEVLRGYPRLLELSYDEIVASRLEYGVTLTRSIIGASAQVRSLTLLIFGDVGRGWNNDEHMDNRPQRQDVGLGIEVMVNLLRLVEFPVRVDIAYPVRDETYKDPEYILFGIFNF